MTAFNLQLTARIIRHLPSSLELSRNTHFSCQMLSLHLRLRDYSLESERQYDDLCHFFTWSLRQIVQSYALRADDLFSFVLEVFVIKTLCGGNRIYWTVGNLELV